MATLLLARVAFLALTSFKSTASMPYPGYTIGSILGNTLLGSKCTIIGMDLESKEIKVDLSNGALATSTHCRKNNKYVTIFYIGTDYSN